MFPVCCQHVLITGFGNYYATRCDVTRAHTTAGILACLTRLYMLLALFPGHAVGEVHSLGGKWPGDEANMLLQSNLRHIYVHVAIIYM